MIGCLMVISLILTFIFPSFASECSFAYVNHGEELVYKCAGKVTKFKIVHQKIVMNNKLAPDKIQKEFLKWRESKKRNQEELETQKDKFNCTP